MNTAADTSITQALMHIGAGRLKDAVDICHAVIEKEPNNAAALHALGLTHYMVRNYAAAIEHMAKAVQFDSMNPQYFCNLGESHRRGGQPDRAIEMFEKSLAIRPEYLLSHLGVANALRDLGRRQEAMARYRLALALDPTFAEAYHYLGAMLLEQDRKTDAIALLRKAVALKPNYLEARLTLAHALDTDGRIDEAREVYETVIRDDPNNSAAHNNVANLLKSVGLFDEAVAHYESALKIDPSNVQAYYNLSRTRPAGDESAEIERMTKLLEKPGLGTIDRMNVHFALGKIFDDLGRYDEAFEQYRQGNGYDNRVPYVPAANTNLVDRLIAVFSRSFFARRDGFGSESRTPVFIVGMPRSGTTLVEQVLASHPDVFGAGELNNISHLINASVAEISGSRGYPESAHDLDAVSACRLGESYVNYVERLAGGAPTVTDKMPGNFMHLGFIALMLRNARILHCVRDPVDTCLSCYFQHFTTPMPFATDLEHLGRYYRDYERLMAHWKKVLPLPVMDVRYEEMIDDHESMVRRIVEFCGLEWNDACIDFHKTDRPVKTASSWQVRQPIYTSSKARWRHYADHLGPLRAALGLPEDADA